MVTSSGDGLPVALGVAIVIIAISSTVVSFSHISGSEDKRLETLKVQDAVLSNNDKKKLE